MLRNVTFTSFFIFKNVLVYNRSRVWKIYFLFLLQYKYIYKNELFFHTPCAKCALPDALAAQGRTSIYKTLAAVAHRELIDECPCVYI